MDWHTAKSLQNSISKGKNTWRKDTDSFEIVEKIESDLEEFTGTACIHFNIPIKKNPS